VPAVISIFVTILLDTLALGVIIPILPKLIESFVDNDTTISPGHCERSEAIHLTACGGMLLRRKSSSQ
jgi:hypothetical protein